MEQRVESNAVFQVIPMEMTATAFICMIGIGSLLIRAPMLDK